MIRNHLAISSAKAASGGPQNYLIVGSDTRSGISKSDPDYAVFNGDNQAPTGTVVINGGAAATNSTTATLTLTATDAVTGQP
jgi:hypothetical protein